MIHLFLKMSASNHDSQQPNINNKANKGGNIADISDNNLIKKSKPNTANSHPAPSTGWAGMSSTSAFRAINFELFVKPNKFVMACGVIAFSSCVSYIVYMNLTDDKRRDNYVTLDEDGGTTVRQRTSRWY